MDVWELAMERRPSNDLGGFWKMSQGRGDVVKQNL